MRYPAEEVRLDPAVFRAGLKKLGLTEVLELHLHDFPPEDEVARLLMQRDIRMAEFSDASLPRARREAAAIEANRILQALIADRPDDSRRFDWLFKLAHSLVYDQAEPVLSKALYRGAAIREVAVAAAATRRAVSAVETLLSQLSAEYKRVDELSIQAFESLERTGYVEQLDRLLPKAQYLRLWALYYDSFWRGDSDPLKARQLNNITAYFEANPIILEAPHERSRVQVQVLLLAGMTERLLHNHAAARTHLDRALSAAGALDDTDELQRVQWAVTLAWVERARNERDRGRFADALHTLKQFHEAIPLDDAGAFGLRLVAALTERTVERARARAAEGAGRSVEAAKARERSWRVLAELGASEPDHRDELFATVWEMIDPSAAPARLDPFEQCAAMAGCLFDAEQRPDRAGTLLDRAVTIGQVFLERSANAAPTLVPQVLYNLGVAEYRRGDMRSAARRFHDVGRQHPEFDRAQRAATLAVHLLSELYEAGKRDGESTLSEGYRAALELIMRRYPGTEVEGYWRFYYAQLLDELGEYGAAAEQFALVDPAHDHYIEGLFLRLRDLGLQLHQQARHRPDEPFPLRQRANELARLYRRFAPLAAASLDDEDAAARRATLSDMLARGRVILAEAHVLAPVDQAQAALDALRGFESDYPQSRDLWGRVWRVRLGAYERLGALDQALRSIPDYIDADPHGAGRTLRALFDNAYGDARDALERGDVDAARRKAEIALVLADQLVTWSRRADVNVSADERRTVLLNRAEASLLAERHEDARDQFVELAPDADARAAGIEDARDVRALFGLAEARYQLGEYEPALRGFNRLAVTLAPEEPMRWRALLRDLQCRSALGEPPQEIIKVIRQQAYLFPDLGGEALAAEFEKLLRESERRTRPD